MEKFKNFKGKFEAFFHKDKTSRGILWVIAGVFPLFLTVLSNYLSYGSAASVLTLVTENTGAFLYGAFLVYLVCLALACLFKKVSTAAGVSSFIFIVLPLIDYFKVHILKEHFLPWDLLMAKNAGSFVEFVSALVIPPSVWVTIAIAVLYWLFLMLAKPVLPWDRKKRILGTPVLLVFLCLFVAHPAFQKSYALFGIHTDEVQSQTKRYENDGFLTAFALNFSTMHVAEPENYNEADVQKLFAKYAPDPESGKDFKNPDIVVVLSESYWDPTALKGVTFSDDPLKNYRAILKEQHGGKMISPTFGGGTVRPEFEILTGMCTSMLPPGNVPYQQYVHDDIFSYARHFTELGYDAVGFHTYEKSFYERDRAYPLLGFEGLLGQDDLHAEQHWNSGPYITDETVAEEIMWQLEQPHDTGLYLMAISMENHGLYADKYDPKDWDIKVEGDALSERDLNILHNYVKGASDADAALGELYDYVMKREKPTVVLWYGDHLPTLGDEFRPFTNTGTIHSASADDWTEEEKYTMFSTPYVMFANYDTGHDYKADGMPVSPFLLSPLMCDFIGAPECLQTNFLLDFFDACPVMSPYYGLYSPNADKDLREEFYRMHRTLTYDELLGKDYLKPLQE